MLRHPRSFLSRSLVALVCLAALPAGPAASQPAPLPSPASASAAPAAADPDALYREGVELAKAKEWPRAYQKLLHAFALKKSFEIAVNLGAAELNLGKYVDAAEHLRHGLAIFAVNGKPEHRKNAEEVLARAKGQIGVVKVTGAPAGAVVRVNERRLGEEDNREEVFVEAGEVRVEVTAKGYEGYSTTVRVEKGGAGEVTVTMKRMAGPAASASATGRGPAVPPMVPEGGPNVPIVIGGVAIGAAALIAGGVLSGVAAATHAQLSNEIPKKPDGSPACSSTEPAMGAHEICNDFRARTAAGITMGHAGIAMFIIGGVLGAGTAVYGLWPRRSTPPRTGVVPVVDLNTAGLVWVGSF